MISALHLIVAAIAAWLTIGVLALVSVRDSARIIRLLFIVGTGVGLLLAVVAFMAMGQIAQSIVLPLGLPDLPFHLRLDSLSAFFLLLLGVTAAGISLFSAGYFRDSEGSGPGLLCLQYHTFLAAMALVLIADDAYVFMVAWESMALSSYFLVTTDHRIAEVRVLTIVGPGGIGKTRLAIEVANQARTAFVDGVFFVPLAVTRDPGLVPSLIARELRLTAVRKPIAEALRDYLREREVLVVLDTFEHLLPAAAFVAELAVACPRVGACANCRARRQPHVERGRRGRQPQRRVLVHATCSPRPAPPGRRAPRHGDRSR